MTQFRADLFSSLVILPITNAFGHLCPAIGASWVAVGMHVLDYPVLTLLFSVHALLDSYDKYRDIPRHKRPQSLTWLVWVGLLSLLIAWGSYECGASTAVRLVWYLGLEVFWAGRLIPVYSPKRGISFVKLREIFGPFKSVFCGVMAGLMDAEPASHHACLTYTGHSVPHEQRNKALAYSILYNFVRETVYDARDIEEDSRGGVTTMATFLGMPYTVATLLIAAVVGEGWIGGNVRLGALSRAVGVVAFSSIVATSQPRGNRWPWAAYSLLSLAPAWIAQTGLK